jgi:hypothetical protein
VSVEKRIKVSERIKGAEKGPDTFSTPLGAGGYLGYVLGQYLYRDE